LVKRIKKNGLKEKDFSQSPGRKKFFANFAIILPYFSFQSPNCSLPTSKYFGNFEVYFAKVFKRNSPLVSTEKIPIAEKIPIGELFFYFLSQTGSVCPFGGGFSRKIGKKWRNFG
jgi:CCR4-NOT transcriptional regulation complex NOT5 subunit